jgi:hypothetical protein
MDNTPIEMSVEKLRECSDSELDEHVRTSALELRRVEAELAITVGELDRRRSQLHRTNQVESP